MGLVHLQCVTVHWTAVISPCFTMEKPSTKLRWKMGQGLLFHAQLGVLMVNHAEFMCYSMMNYYGNRPLWKFPRQGIPRAIKPCLSVSVSLYLSACLFSLFRSCFFSLYLPPHLDFFPLCAERILNMPCYFQRRGSCFGCRLCTSHMTS